MQVGRWNDTYVAAGRMMQVGEKVKQAGNQMGKRDTYISGNDLSLFSEKLAMAEEYQKKMQDLKEKDPAKYMELMMEQELSEVKSLGRLTEVAERYGGTVAFRGVTMVFDTKEKKMCLGDMNKGDIINAGVMSNGYCFYFNRENIGDLSKIIDLFSPEDVNKIMAAIATDNVADHMKNEIEDEKANAVQEKL